MTLLVGASPGTGADTWARSFAPFLERHWPRCAVSIANRPGERGLAAARFLAAAPPDGRLLCAVATPLLLARAVEANEAMLLDRLLFVARVAEEPVVLVAHPAAAGDLAALRALRPQPTLGTPPPGTAAQLAAFDLGRATPLRPLGFPSAAAARQAVLAGHIGCAMLPLPEAVAAVRDGRLAALGIAERQRSILLPEVPTFREQGLDLLHSTHRGFAVPAGTEAAALQPLVTALRDAVLDPEFAALAEASGNLPRFGDAAEWAVLLRQSVANLAGQWTTDPWIARRN